jgi:hypothetical protein
VAMGIASILLSIESSLLWEIFDSVKSVIDVSMIPAAKRCVAMVIKTNKYKNRLTINVYPLYVNMGKELCLSPQEGSLLYPHISSPKER